MKTILIILGTEQSALARGDFNKGLFETAVEILSAKYKILTTIIDDGYDSSEEIKKFKKADFIIYQYPIYWYTHPASLKEYTDNVFRYGDFFTFKNGLYKPEGLLEGKSFMLSTTWSSPADAFNNEDSPLKGSSIDEMLLPMRRSNTFCGLTELEHFSCHNVVMDPQFDKDKHRYIKHLTKTFKLK